jgi:hypothetical protein
MRDLVRDLPCDDVPWLAYQLSEWTLSQSLHERKTNVPWYAVLSSSEWPALKKVGLVGRPTERFFSHLDEWARGVRVSKVRNSADVCFHAQPDCQKEHTWKGTLFDLIHQEALSGFPCATCAGTVLRGRPSLLSVSGVDFRLTMCPHCNIGVLFHGTNGTIHCSNANCQ